MRLKFLSIFVALLCLFSFAAPVHASSNFTTDYHVTYSAAENGNTHAVLQIVLTNTTSQFYPSAYRVQLGFDTITNVRVGDPEGPINPKLSKSSDGYYIDVTFNKKAVGKGTKLPFTIEFDTPSIAKRYGKIWEITIPGIANPEDFTTFTVEVRTPPSFGKPTYIKPKQQTESLTFTKDQLKNSGISIAFGQKQAYTFHLTYHLQNTNVYPTKTSLALPPSTNYQKVFITGISPQPDNVIQDEDGNWLAQYTLASTQKMDVVVNGKAEVSFTPSQQELTAKERDLYLKDIPYWQANNDKIRELADELITPENIYRYVISNLQYDFSRVNLPAGGKDKPRLGALEALNQKKSAACREFTDLFIALARAAKIPAREVNGFAYTENTRQRPVPLIKDVLHAWPEYYDDKQKTWIMIDPTWGSTTGGIDYFSVLDFDHLAFVIKGRDSNSPLPAGGYKLPDQKDTKDVQVTFAQSLPDDIQTADITTTIPDVLTAGFPISGEILIKNTGSTAFAGNVIYASSQTLSPHDQTMTSPSIPPFGTARIKIGYNAQSFLTNNKETFTIRIGGKTISQTIRVAPFFLTKNGGGIIVGLFALIICIIALKSRRLRVSRHR